MQNEILKGADPRVFILDHSIEGAVERVFVVSKGIWYERIEGQTGAVEFLPIADGQQELRERTAGETGEFDLLEAEDDLGEEVIREFMEQTPLYPEAPELSDQWN